MSKLFIIIQLTIILFTTFLLPAWEKNAGAYWLDEESSTVTTINDLRKYAPPSDRKDLFTVQFYDSTPAADRDANTPAILPHSDYFIPADIIDANLPIFGLFSHPAEPAKDPLANLLYANLKIKKLLEEYAALQTSAVEHLGSHISTTDHFQSFMSLQTANNQEKEPDQQANTPSYKPIISYYNNLRSLQGRIAHDRRPLILREHATRQQTPEQPRTTAAALEPYACGEATNTFRNSSRLPGYTSNYSTYQSRQETTLPAAEQPEPREQRTTTREDHKLQPVANDRLGKFILSFRKYIIDHPLEFILFAVIGICTLNFITRIVLGLLGI